MEENKKEIALIDLMFAGYIIFTMLVTMFGVSAVRIYNGVNMIFAIVLFVAMIIIGITKEKGPEKTKILVFCIIVIHTAMMLEVSRIISCFCQPIYPEGYRPTLLDYLERGKSYAPITVYLGILLVAYFKKIKLKIESNKKISIILYIILFTILTIIIGFSRPVFAAIFGLPLH